MDEAMDAFQRLPDRHAGHLFLDNAGGLVTDFEKIMDEGAEGRAVGATRGGTWPSGPDIDHALVARVIEAFGWDGRKATSGHDPADTRHP
jgi:hypothetical protein